MPGDIIPILGGRYDIHPEFPTAVAWTQSLTVTLDLRWKSPLELAKCRKNVLMYVKTVSTLMPLDISRFSQDLATRILAAWYLLGQDSPDYPAVNFNAWIRFLGQDVDVQDGHGR